MRYFKVPEGIDCIGVPGLELPVVEGLIEMDEPSQELVNELRISYGVVEATLEQVERVGEIVTEKAEKARLLSELREMGIAVDGRTGLAILQARYDRAIKEADARAAKAAAVGTKPPDTSTAPPASA